MAKVLELLLHVREGEGGKSWENGIETCKISCMKRVAGPGSMHEGAVAQIPGREAALAWASLAQRFPASSVLARVLLNCGVGEDF